MEPREAPTNVRLVGRDGTEHPVQVAWLRDEDGISVWEVVDCPPGQWVRMLADKWPAKTSIRLPVVLDE